MKRPFRALMFLSAIEIVIYLAIVTAVWAVVDHDLASLSSSFYRHDGHPEARAAVGVALGLAIAINAAMLIAISRAGKGPVAWLVLPITGGIASLFFLPTWVSVCGLGAIVGAAIVIKTLAMIKRRLFGKKAPDKDAPPRPKTAAPSKKAG